MIFECANGIEEVLSDWASEVAHIIPYRGVVGIISPTVVSVDGGAPGTISSCLPGSAGVKESPKSKEKSGRGRRRNANGGPTRELEVGSDPSSVCSLDHTRALQAEFAADTLMQRLVNKSSVAQEPNAGDKAGSFLPTDGVPVPTPPPEESPWMVLNSADTEILNSRVGTSSPSLVASLGGGPPSSSPPIRSPNADGQTSDGGSGSLQRSTSPAGKVSVPKLNIMRTTLWTF